MSDPPLPQVVDASFVASAETEASLPPPAALEVAFVGRSNVGKSSLMNALMARRNLVRTSNTPGCTRAINFFQAKLRDGARLHLVDLPGYGYAKRSKTEREQWAGLIEDYLLGRPTLAMAVVLIDVRRGIGDDDRDALELIASEARAERRPVEVLLVATKTDKLRTSERKRALAKITRESGVKVVGFSTRDPLGPSQVWKRIRARIGLGDQGTDPRASPP